MISSVHLKLNTLLKTFFISLILILSYLIFTASSASAVYNPATGTCEGAPGTEYLDASVCEAHGEGPPPPARCNAGGDWLFQYPVCKVDTIEPIPGKVDCEYTYSYASFICSAADSCPAPPRNPEPYPYLNPGWCSAASYIPGDPQSACVPSPTKYKTCCVGRDLATNSCTGTGKTGDGKCPSGSDPVICGVSAADCVRVKARYPTNPCTTAQCGPDACRDIFPNPAPDLVTFDGACSGTIFEADLTWSGDPLDANAASCADGFWVDIGSILIFT